MAIRPNSAIRRQLRTVFNLGTIGALTDGQLLERFGTHGGEAAELAFAALVERHGPMVLRVCRHVLADPNDAEDSFQATFLILVKKARSLWVQDSLGPWLHRVAHRVATRARYSTARLREHEKRAGARRPALVRERGDWDELLSLLHEEIDRLPEPYRLPVVLCDLQGLTHEKAARHLGWPVGTVKSRLARGRELLRGRLSRRGLGLPAGVTIGETALGGACRAVELVPPGTLVESTLRAVAAIAAGRAPAIGTISSRVAILIEEVLRTMVVTKLKLASVFVLIIGAAGAAGVLAQQGSSSGASPGGRPIPQHGGVGSAHAPAPAYITQSRAMILARLEEEVAEARARLERTLRKFPSLDNPAAVRARETLEALVQRLDRIDRVFVDVVETYPTMVDFSRGPSDARITSQVGLGAVSQESGGDVADDSSKQRQGGEPRYPDKTDDSSKQRQGGEPRYPDKTDNSSKQGQSSERQYPDKADDARKQGQSGEPQDGNNQDGSRPRDKNVERKDPKPRAGGHGSGVVATDLNDDGVIDLFIVNGGTEYLGPKGQPQRTDASKETTETRTESPTAAGRFTQTIWKARTEEFSPRGPAKNRLWPTRSETAITIAAIRIAQDSEDKTEIGAMQRPQASALFQRVMIEAHERRPIRILSYSAMSNHCHFALWPEV